MKLNGSEEVYRYIGETFKSAFDDPRLGPTLEGRRLRLRFGLIDPDCVLDIDTERKEVRMGDHRSSVPSAMVAMNGDNANLCCQGRLDVSEALASGDIVVEGSGYELLELVSQQDTFAHLYVDTLKREGRQDLLAC